MESNQSTSNQVFAQLPSSIYLLRFLLNCAALFINSGLCSIAQLYLPQKGTLATLIASGRLKGCSICGGSAFIGFETGESRADVLTPGFDVFF